MRGKAIKVPHSWALGLISIAPDRQQASVSMFGPSSVTNEQRMPLVTKCCENGRKIERLLVPARELETEKRTLSCLIRHQRLCYASNMITLA